MLRKIICIVWAVCVVTGFSITAQAAQTGVVRIIPTWCGQPVSGGTVSVSRIGIRTKEGIQMTDGLANWVVEEQSLYADPDQDWLIQMFGEDEQSRPVKEETGAVFHDLQEGIYLVQQSKADTEQYSFAPFFLSVPESDSWEIIRHPPLIRTGEAPKTGDHPAPIIAAMGLGLSAAVLMVLVDEHKK